MMVLAADVRRQKLQQLRQNSEQAAEHQKLYYRAQTQSFPVFRIDLDALIYNRHNGRLEAEMLTWEREHTASPGVYDDQLHELIEGFLWKSSVRANEQTMKDLQLKQQQRAGIVSADGVIIDGNRRAMLLRRIERDTKQKQYFEAIILPDAYAENEKEIVRLETQYQLGEDAKVEYGPLQKYLHVKRLKRGLGIEESEIAKLMNETEGRIATLLGTMDLMSAVLDSQLRLRDVV